MPGVITSESITDNRSHAEPRDHVEECVLAFLAFANVFDLGGGFGLKYLSYALCALFLVTRRDYVHMSRPVFLTCAVLFVIWPLISAIQGMGYDANLGRAIQRITAFAPALLVMPILASSRRPRHLLDAIMSSLLALAIVIIFLFCLFLLLPRSGYTQFLRGVLAGGVHGYFGLRGVGSILVPVVYFKATLFLVPACIWYFYKRSYVASAICFVALICAFSRSGALIAAAVLGVHGFLLAPFRVRAGLVCLLVAVGYVLWSDMYLDVLTGRGESASQRIGHFYSIIDLLSHDARILWLGQGAGVSFFSTGVNGFVTAVELDHLDAIRTFGLLWFIGFSAVVFRAAGVGMHLASKEARGIRVALIASYFASGTNPVLISPLFCMLAAVSYYFLSTERSTGQD